METNQIAQMIEWLDEERRRDKNVIATLEERLAQQEETIGTLQRRINSIESDQTVMKESTLPVQKERDIADQVRTEMRQLLESSEARRLAAEREAERRYEINRENMMRTVRELQDHVQGLQRSTGSLSEVRTEGSRISDNVGALQQRVEDLIKQLEEPARRISFLEEQRRQDARRISEIETEIPEVKKQIDSVRPKVTLIEDLAIRNERRVQEVHNTEHERREQIQQFIDQQSLAAQQRDQKVNDLIKRFAEHDSAMQQNMERFETWASVHREMQRILSDFDRIGERLERRINEVAEMQRLSEERFRQEWNDWRDDDQKRWKQLTLSNDEVWRNHDKEFDLFISRFEELRAQMTPLMDSVKRLWNLERDRAQMYRDQYQNLLHTYDKTDQNQLNVGSASVPSQSNGMLGGNTVNGETS